MKKIIMIGIMLILIFAATASAFNYYKQNDKKGFYKAIIKCRTDSDCYITSSTCCLCNSGGTQIAVNELGLDYYNWWKCNYCPPIIRCKMVYNCIAEEARCINRTCSLWIPIQY